MDNSTDLKPWEIVSETLKYLVPLVRPGMTTKDLDKLAEEKVLELGGRPYNKGYHPTWAETPFPATICTCVNDQIAHGIPSDYILQDGDLLNIDIGVEKDGLCGDSGLSVPVGQLSGRDERLLRYTKRTLYIGIDQVRAGTRVGDIGIAMDKYARQMGYVINFAFGGHGIGKRMHEEPRIPHCELPGFGDEILKEGQMICLEPMLTYKDPFGKSLPDGWCWVTGDGRKSAMFEHQLLVTKDGCEILTTHIERS